MNSYQVRAMARKLLNELGITSFPFDLINLAKEISASIMFSKELPEKISGYLLPFSNGKSNFLIGVNEDKTPGHRRFTIAHEIGHIVNGDYRYEAILLDTLELDTSETERRPFMQHPFMQHPFMPRERLANVFATELLMPSYMVKRYYVEGEKDVNLFCERFGVSFTAMKIRLFDELGYDEKEFWF